MATRIDNNSKELNSEQIKETLTNLINKTAQKAVAESSYDRTVLAQIIYCTDASNGQYKIKYQNGYYTAYSVGDTNIKYSDGATVYVLVPQNDLHNRLLIQGLATNDSSQRTYLTFLEEGQQFALHGENWVKNSETATGLDLSSSWDMPTGREVFYYKYKNENVKKISLISGSRIISSLEDSEDGNCYFRLGAEFKTDILDYRKTSGNYGIRAVLVFNEFNADGTRNLSKEYKLTYQLDTFNMIGAPFEFNDYTERYAFFKIDRAAFCRIESISGFVEGFPENNDNVESDIFIKRPSMYAALKLYNDTVDSSYVVQITGPDGFVFDIPTTSSSDPVRESLRLQGDLIYNGSKIDPKNVEFFWGKKDISVDSKAHIKYMDYLGEGWRCLNTGQATKMTSDDLDEAKNYTITNSTPDNKGYMGVIKWDSLQEINLLKSNCKGRTTIIKCCARYENKTYESREQIIINTTGIYLLWDSSEGTTFYNGNGTTDITVGLFQTQDDINSYKSTPIGAGGSSSTFQPSTAYSFVWTLETNNVKLKLPPVTMSDLLPSEPDWSSTHKDISDLTDTPDKDNDTVDRYLGELASQTGIDQVLLKNCYQRWSYYTDCYQTYEGNTTDTYYKRAKQRADAIKANWQAYLDKKYIANNPNDTNYYILGPSNVTAKWNTDPNNLKTMFSNRTDPYGYAKIDSIEHSYNNGLSVYQPYQRNTLYKFPAALIRGQAKITVSATQTETDSAGGTFVDTIETQEIYLTNQEGSGLKYDLQITNGNQNFVYSAGGKKPNISIKPLSFQLFDQGGILVFDSEKDINDEKNQTILEELRPKWKFHQTNTLLKTSYIGTENCNVDTNESNTYIVSKQPFFYYDIEDDYNVNYKDRSNITLSVSYMGSTYTASTHFTFSKQGDLGTNGTNMLLHIEDNVYEQYRSDVLSRDKFCFLSKSNGKNSDVKEYYNPDARHLKRTYIYATEIYDATKHSQSGFSEGDFCNLQFAQRGSESATENPTSPMYIGLNGSNSITLYGYWNEDGEQTSVDSTSTWAAHSGEYQKVKDQTKVGRSNVYDRASFQTSSKTGSSIQLTLEPLTGTSVDDGTAVYYKPMGVIKQEAGIDYKWTAYNVVQCTANHTVSSQINPQTGEPIVRTNYGYYQIPFFYYGYYEKQNNGVYKNVTPKNLDPARHFVITGGFDEIAYDADGMNPQYNKQEPFTVRLFDEKGNDITETAFSSNSISIVWDCAYGFNSQPAIKEIKNYPDDFKKDEDLYGQYCRYNNHTYLCNTSHTKSQKIEIKDAKGEVTNTFNPGDFVTPYWVPISPTLKKRTRQITPPPSFDALAMDSFFSSWVSVQVTYTVGNKKYEAAALMPVNAFCNIYGSDEINAWDGKKTVVDDGYIISNKITAGYKDNSHAFIGITIGSKMITNNTGSEDQLECGLFGYGKYDNSNLPAGRVGYGQTLFLDAKTGLAAFGPRGSTQIILNPKIPRGGEQSWSRLAGWYFSKDFLYKPLYAEDNYDGINDSSYIETATGKMVSQKSRYSIEDFLEPPDADGNTIPGSIGMYVPSSASKSVSSSTVWLWASAAGQAALDFTDNGAADVLAGAVKKIKNYFTKDDFPYYYSYKSSTRRIKVKTIQGFCITNITRLTDTYTSNEYRAAHQSVSDITWIDNLLLALQDYTSEFYNLVNDIKLASGGEDLLDSLETVITNITELNYPSLPIASYPYILSPETPDSYRIDNIKDLKTWYLDNNDYRVTKHTNFLTNLNEYINSYESYWSQIANMVETDEEILRPKKDELSVLTNRIKTLFESCPGYVNEPIPTWNTLKPHKPEVSTDKYTIKNIDTIAEEYGAAAFTASTKAKNYITQLNNQIEVYNTYYTQYQNWLNLMNDPDVAGGAVGYKNVQNKKDELNFYVTYGGEMHSKKATIEGKITAKTGQIGEGAEALLIGINKSDDTFLDGGSRYFLLWNEAFKLSYQEPINNQKSRSNCWLKGEIFATGGHIGDVDNPSGDSNSTIHLMYKWYPRKLPDSNITWGSTTPEYDYSQGTKVTYSLWSPYFSIISDAGGAVNYGADGETVDFTYSAGDATFLGRIYATGGRLGDWVCDNEHDILRDPYDTIKLKPALDKSNPASGWINCGMTTIYGDGSIDGCCHVPRGSEEEAQQYAFQPLPHKWASWWINSEGEVHFLDAKQIWIGSQTLEEYIESVIKDS